MEKMKFKNQQLVQRRLRSEADENQYKEQEEARQLAQHEQLTKMQQKREEDNRIQNAIEYRTLYVILTSLQREEARQKKLGKALEWDQDKPPVDEDGSFWNP